MLDLQGLFVFILLFSDACLDSNKREKEMVWVCVGGEKERICKEFRIENCKQNILYEKSIFNKITN